MLMTKMNYPAAGGESVTNSQSTVQILCIGTDTQQTVQTKIRLRAPNFLSNLSCRASAPENSLVLTKNLLALLLRSENVKILK